MIVLVTIRVTTKVWLGYYATTVNCCVNVYESKKCLQSFYVIELHRMNQK